MGNYKFYTPPLLAECLINLLPNKEYESVIDICCGSWNLLEAAKKKYTNSNYVGVDIDAGAEESRIDGADFYCEDGRKFAINKKRKYDLVLSNPPFGYLKEDERLLNNIGDSKRFIKGILSKRYENEMMQANLLLVKKDGVLLFILPTTFLEGDTYLSIRKELCRRYTIDSIIKLPIETFGNSKINTFAMIMINSGKQKTITKLMEVSLENEKWCARQVSDISIDKMKNGRWVGKDKKKNKVNVELFRGNISTAHMSKTGTKVFHCSSMMKDGTWEPSVRYCDDEVRLKNAKIAMPGDIIVNRIGRYANYWCVCKEKGIISDCLIVVRETENRDVYNCMINNSTNGRLNIDTRGVTTNYITISDIVGIL